MQFLASPTTPLRRSVRRRRPPSLGLHSKAPQALSDRSFQCAVSTANRRPCGPVPCLAIAVPSSLRKRSPYLASRVVHRSACPPAAPWHPSAFTHSAAAWNSPRSIDSHGMRSIANATHRWRSALPRSWSSPPTRNRCVHTAIAAVTTSDVTDGPGGPASWCAVRRVSASNTACLRFSFSNSRNSEATVTREVDVSVLVL